MPTQEEFNRYFITLLSSCTHLYFNQDGVLFGDDGSWKIFSIDSLTRNFRVGQFQVVSKIRVKFPGVPDDFFRFYINNCVHGLFGLQGYIVVLNFADN